MFYRLSGALRWMASALAVAIVFTLLAPSTALAQVDRLQIGVSAVVTDTGGDPILVRQAPGYDALVVLHVFEGDVVEITEGPVQLDDGSRWYGVLIQETPGYIASNYLVPAPTEVTSHPVSEGANPDASLPQPSAVPEEIPVEAPVTGELETAEISVAEEPFREPVTSEYSVSGPVVAASSDETVAISSEEEPTVNALAQDDSASTMAIGGPGSAVTTAPLNLRSGPGTGNPVLLVIPAGATVSVSGDAQSGFLPIAYNGSSGWASADFIAQDGGSTPAPAPSTGTGTTMAPLNFRNGPGTGYGVISVIPAGATVSLTGDSSGGFVSITYTGTSGWVSSDYVSTGSAPAPQPEPQPQPAPSTGTGTTTANVHLRSGPSTADQSLTVIPAGSAVSLTGQSANGFLSVSFNGLSGWSYADFIQIGPAPTPAPTTPTPPPATSTGTAVTTANLNLRSGPGTTSAALTVIPSGSTVSITGAAQNGFLPVTYNGTSGWASADFLSVSGQPAPNPAPPAPTTLTTTANLNLRATASLSGAVLTVIPQGTSVSVTGSAQNGFLPVTYNGQSGWASADFLGASGNPGENPGGNPGTIPPPSGGSGIIWPVSGGTWSIIQGYNGGSHQNRSSTAQYYYALDIARADGNTAGQAVYAPASGTILWLDPGSGGIAINMGNGYTIAMFHSTFDGSLARGQSVSQGQYLGTVSGPGGPGYASTPHVDMTLWYTGGGGRAASPFSGANAISGMSFPDVGGANQHGGTSFTP
jgi:uncharacterized protein YraI